MLLIRRSFNIIFLSLLFFASNCGYSQIFGLLQKVPKNYYYSALRYTADGKYKVLNGRAATALGVQQKTQILQYGFNLQLEDSIDLLRGLYVNYYTPQKIFNKVYWAGGYFDTINSQIREAAIIELDANYNYLTFHKIGFVTTNFYTISNLVSISNRLYVGIREFLPTGGKSSKIYKLTDQFVKLDSITINTGISNIYSINDQLIVTGGGFPSPCNDPFGGRMQNLSLDTSFSVLSCFTFDSLTTITNNGVSNKMAIKAPYCQVVPISNTKVLALGNFVESFAMFTPVSDVMINSILDNHNKVQKTIVYSSPTRAYSYVDWLKCYDIKDDKIITVGCIDFNLSVPPTYQYQKTKIFVNKLDTNGNQIWVKEHGGDMFYYPRSIAFTADGGCLISGFRYDSTNTAIKGVMQNFLLKLDANGDCLDVGIFENGKPNAQPVKCFPNPGNDRLYFDIPFQDEIEIEIYNNLGQLVLKEKNYQSLEVLDVALLANGAYYYKIRTRRNNYSGKFLKE